MLSFDPILWFAVILGVLFGWMKYGRRGARESVKTASGEAESLHLAAVQGDCERVRRLLEQGADPDAWIEGSTALYAAAFAGHIDVVRTLLEKGANVELGGPGRANDMDEGCETPLRIAVEHGHQDVAGLLVEYGASQEELNALVLTEQEWAEFDAVVLNCARRLREVGKLEQALDVYVRALDRWSHSGPQSPPVAMLYGMREVAEIQEMTGASERALDTISYALYLWGQRDTATEPYHLWKERRMPPEPFSEAELASAVNAPNADRAEIELLLRNSERILLQLGRNAEAAGVATALARLATKNR